MLQFIHPAKKVLFPGVAIIGLCLILIALLGQPTINREQESLSSFVKEAPWIVSSATTVASDGRFARVALQSYADQSFISLPASASQSDYSFSQRGAISRRDYVLEFQNFWLLNELFPEVGSPDRDLLESGQKTYLLRATRGLNFSNGQLLLTPNGDIFNRPGSAAGFNVTGITTNQGEPSIFTTIGEKAAQTLINRRSFAEASVFIKAPMPPLKVKYVGVDPADSKRWIYSIEKIAGTSVNEAVVLTAERLMPASITKVTQPSRGLPSSDAAAIVNYSTSNWQNKRILAQVVFVSGPPSEQFAVTSIYPSQTSSSHTSASQSYSSPSASWPTRSPSAPLWINSLSPQAGEAHDTFTINGSGFWQNGNIKTDDDVIIGSQTSIRSIPLNSLDGTTLSVVMPYDMEIACILDTIRCYAITATGDYQVKVQQHQTTGPIVSSNSLPFRVKSNKVTPLPWIALTLAPASGQSGDLVTLYGQGFHSTRNNIIFTRIDSGATSTVSDIPSTTPNEISFLLPELPTGQYKIAVQSLVYENLIMSSNDPLIFTVRDYPIPPSIDSMSPSQGPINTLVTLVGLGFDPQNNTVTFGNNWSQNLASTKINTREPSDYRSITFTVPSQFRIACPQSNPGNCLTDIKEGKYPVSVTVTKSGIKLQSASVQFIVNAGSS